MSGAELLTTLLKTISDTVLIIDKADRVSYCGGGSPWVKLEVLRGKPISKIFSEEVGLFLTSLCEQTREGEETQETELALTPENAPLLSEHGLEKKSWYRLNTSLMGDKVILSLHDITQQRELIERANSQSQRDPLTGAYNRKALVPVLNQAVAQAQRYEFYCSLVLIDIDGFSTINDKFGWDAGDKVLQALVDSLDKMKRTSDFLVRIGDDRLAMMLPETNRDQSVAMGHRIVRLVDEMEVATDAATVRFHVSVATSSLQGIEDSAEQMIKRADENLTVAKQSGGDRVEGDEV